MYTPGADADYILTFSSSYKALYARDKLRENGIFGQIRKTPAELFRTCGQSLLLQGYALNEIFLVLEQSQIETRGAFQVIRNGEKAEYRRIR